ncbi:MAG: phosphotransferase [Planctomycetota bacterium]
MFAVTPHGPRELSPAADAALPRRALLADRAALAAALAPHVGPLRDARLVAWRPGRRAVVRVDAGDGATWWLKLLDGRGHRRAARLFAALGEGLPPMALCAPTAMLPEFGAHLAPHARGTALRTLLQRGDAPALPTLCRSLLALGCTAMGGRVPRIDFAAARDAAVGMLEKGAAAEPGLAALAARIAALPDLPLAGLPAFVHGDLHDKQVFLHQDGAAVIDLEGAGCGDARVDLVNLAEHLRLRELQQGSADSGFGDRVLARCGIDPEARDTLAFRAVVRARLCGVYALRPRWAALVTRLRRELDSLLDRQP